PDGAIHVGQELSFSLNRDTESEVVARARVASRGERQGWVLMGIELSVESESGAVMMSGRATITFPVSGGPAGGVSGRRRCGRTEWAMYCRRSPRRSRRRRSTVMPKRAATTVHRG